MRKCICKAPKVMTRKKGEIVLCLGFREARYWKLGLGLLVMFDNVRLFSVVSLAAAAGE